MAKKATAPVPGGDMARKIWLAGIGAYGRAFTEAQESIAKVSVDSSRMFEDLVAKGEEIEDTVEEKGRKLAKRVKTKAPAFSIDDRIKNMRARLHIGDEHDDDRLAAIEARLDSIDAKLEMLLTGSKNPVRKKTAAKKTKS